MPSGSELFVDVLFIGRSTQRGKYIKGLIWPPIVPKTENCISPIPFHWFIRRLTDVKIGIYLNFTVAMETKMADKIG